MAHYKRRYAKTKTRGRKRNCHKWIDGKNNWGGMRFMCSWPRYWDVEFHRRPKRRKIKRALVALKQGADPDNLAWPLGNHKPHSYYW